jgi:hypothetical protein
MTGQETIDSFKVYYDRVTSFSAPGYLDSEILLFLNNAQDQFIKDKVFGQNFQPPAFEDNQKRVVDISTLLARQTLTSGINPNTGYGPQAYTISKSAVQSGRVLYTTTLEARITRLNPTVTAGYLECIKIKTEHIGKFMHSAVNKTHHVKPKFVETNNHWIMIGDSHTTLIDGARVGVIRTPYPITAAMLEYNGTYGSGVMNLHPSVHQEIVDIAVQQALQVSSDPRWQSKVNQEQLDTK